MENINRLALASKLLYFSDNSYCSSHPRRSTSSCHLVFGFLGEENASRSKPCSKNGGLRDNGWSQQHMLRQDWNLN